VARLLYDPLLPLLHKAEKDHQLREVVGRVLLEIVAWTHGRRIEFETYHNELAVKLAEVLSKYKLTELQENLEVAGQVRPETLLFSIFGFPDRVNVGV
jgi:hypothetical protein